MNIEDEATRQFKIHPHAELSVTSKRIDYTLEEVFQGKLEEVHCDFDYDKAAKDLIDSFNGHECVAFLEAIHKISAQEIVRQWRKYSPKRLEEDQYKKYLEYEDNQTSI